MSNQKHDLSPMHVLGVSCRTSDTEATRDIGALWARAGALGLLSSRPEAFAVYHQYVVENGHYEVTVTVGRAARADQVVPEGLSLVEVPAQHGSIIRTDGNIPSVQQGWASVWTRWPDGAARSFVADLEQWKMGADGRPASADIFFGLK